MKTEIELSELLKQITPLPLEHQSLMAYASDGGAAFHCGLGLRGPPESHRMEFTAAYLTHCANVLPELVEAARVIVDKIPRDGYALDDWEKLDDALSRSEKVKLP